MSDSLLTPEQVAEILNLHVDTTRRLLRERRIPGVKLGVVWRTKPDELKRWIAARSHDGTLPRIAG